jgi:putative ABC transport system permease protein
MLKSVRMRLRALFRRSDVEAEMEEELRFHLEQQTKLYVRQGMSREDGEREARLAFGSVESARESHRDNRGTRNVEDTIADTRYALRTLWRDRGLSAAGVLTLALGIGGTTAVFSAVNAVLLRDLPFAQPERLVAVWEENPERNWYKNVVAPANYLDWRERVKSFDGLAGYTDFLTNVTLVGEGEPKLLRAAYTTGNFLSVLGVTPAIGRGFDGRDDWDEGQRPLILSYRLWRTQFRGDTAVVGKTISFLGSRPWQIVGVMPDGFAMPSSTTDIWMPILWARGDRDEVWFRRAHWMRVVGRLKPGVSHEAATAELQTVAKQLEREYPATNVRMGAGITPLHDWIVGDTRREPSSARARQISGAGL